MWLVWDADPRLRPWAVREKEPASREDPGATPGPGHPPPQESVLTPSLDPPFSYGAPVAVSCLLSDNPALCHLALPLPLLKRLSPLSILSNLRGLHIAFTPSRRRVFYSYRKSVGHHTGTPSSCQHKTCSPSPPCCPGLRPAGCVAAPPRCPLDGCPNPHES